jgi:hypothetical protein
MINFPCLRSRCGISCVCPYENILTDSVEVVITNDFATAWPLALHGRHAENRVRLAGLERSSPRYADFANKTRHHSYTVNYSIFQLNSWKCRFLEHIYAHPVNFWVGIDHKTMVISPSDWNHRSFPTLVSHASKSCSVAGKMLFLSVSAHTILHSSMKHFDGTGYRSAVRLNSWTCLKQVRRVGRINSARVQNGASAADTPFLRNRLASIFLF